MINSFRNDAEMKNYLFIAILKKQVAASKINSLQQVQQVYHFIKSSIINPLNA
jgi:hypothetical protein